jgi:hypothetical protein
VCGRRDGRGRDFRTPVVKLCYSVVEVCDVELSDVLLPCFAIVFGRCRPSARRCSMRLSGLVIASILLASTPLLAQHSSGGGGASSGCSHGGYSGGSVGSASSASSHASSSSASHASSTSMVSHSAPSFKSPPSKDITPEKQSSRSFFHPFRKAKPVQTAELKVPSLCLKGQCAICPRGQARNRNGACVAASNACSAGQPWNGFSCGWSNNCNMLARDLEEQR